MYNLGERRIIGVCHKEKNPKYRKKVFRRKERKRESLFRTREAFGLEDSAGFTMVRCNFTSHGRINSSRFLGTHGRSPDLRRKRRDTVIGHKARYGVRAVPFLRRRMFCIIAQSRY